MTNVVKFDQSFDATMMSADEIRQEARRRKWPGIRIDAKEVSRTNRVIVRRLSEKRAYGE